MTRRFNKLQERANFHAAQTGGQIEAITKELLHYDILHTLSEMGAFKDGITFQGGTALRLCYGGRRYSEDLDFATGPDFDFGRLEGLATNLTAYLEKTWGLECNVRPPKHTIDTAKEEVQIATWQLAVVMDPVRRDLPQQKIKIEFANVRALTREPRPFTANFEGSNQIDTIIRVESMDEIFADKIMAAGNRPFFKARDLFDLKFLSDRGAEFKTDLLLPKIDDYHVQPENFLKRLELYREELPTQRDKWNAEMSRFTDGQLKDLVLDADFFDSLCSQVSRSVRQAENEIRQALNIDPPEPENKPRFRL